MESKAVPAMPIPSISSKLNLLSSVKYKMGGNIPSVNYHPNLDYDGRKFYIVSVKGSAYEMGEAYGTLLKEELKVMQK